jgi:4-hydroxy-3-methylbut-2-enyl diphosphate reductase
VTDLVIAAPMRVEALLVASAARGASVHKTGMGPKHAKAAALALERTPGDALLVLGCCGGLDEHARPGEVIVAEQVSAGADEGHPETPVACADAQDLAAALRIRGIPVRLGEIVSVSTLALGERRAQLLAAGALAVDMESVWLAAAAAGRPFAVVRVVLDSPSHELLRPQALAGALRAARTLRRVASILRDWTPGRAGASNAAPAPEPAGGIQRDRPGE